jgi:hypothetical protein
MLLQRLKFANAGGIDSVLKKTIPFGIAFHNSGSQSRDLLNK